MTRTIRPEPDPIEVQTAWAVDIWRTTGRMPSPAAMRHQFDAPTGRALTIARAFITARMLGHTVTFDELSDPAKAIRAEMRREAEDLRQEHPQGKRSRLRFPLKIT